MKFKRILFVLQILFALGWMAVIFNFSNQNFSKSNHMSDEFLYKIVETVKGRKLTAVERTRIKKKYVYFIRKTAHFFLYFILGAIIYIFLSMILKSPYKTVLLSILICFLYACSDEVHQLFVPGRTGQMFDVMIDTCGSMVSISLVLLFRSFINFIVYLYGCIFKKKS